jgi:hypothetical protein
LNETFLNTKNSGRVVFGFQFGNFMRPKEFAGLKSPVPVDIPRIRYEILTRKVGHSAPVADAGPDQIGVAAGQVVLDGSGSYSPDGDTLTYAWTQIGGPAVGLSGANTVRATFEAAAGQTYSFRLIVHNPYGQQSAARVTVSTTSAGSNLHIGSFTASPTTVVAGGRSTLSWQVDNAEQVSISPSVGSVDAKSGSVDVMPTQTTQYTLTATAGGKSISSTAVVTVSSSAPQILRFDATPTQINQGESSTLTWNTQGAQTVQISGIGMVPASGSQTVTPTASTTYTLTATSADGTQTTTTVSVTVRSSSSSALRIASFTSSPEYSPAAGSPVVLSWRTENATSVTITGNGVPSSPLDPSGSITVYPSTNSTYTLTAHSADGRSTSVVLSVFVR